jgi:hypothetical protein
VIELPEIANFKKKKRKKKVNADQVKSSDGTYYIETLTTN